MRDCSSARYSFPPNYFHKREGLTREIRTIANLPVGGKSSIPVTSQYHAEAVRKHEEAPMALWEFTPNSGNLQRGCTQWGDTRDFRRAHAYACPRRHANQVDIDYFPTIYCRLSAYSKTFTWELIYDMCNIRESKCVFAQNPNLVRPHGLRVPLVTPPLRYD